MPGRTLVSLIVASLAWLAGVVGILEDHWGVSQALGTCLHVLFFALTCTTFSLILGGKARLLSNSQTGELYQFARLVSRWTYIAMYGLAAVYVCLHYGRVGAPCALCAPIAPPAGFQFYLVAGVLPLWLIRALVLHPMGMTVYAFLARKRRAFIRFPQTRMLHHRLE